MFEEKQFEHFMVKMFNNDINDFEQMWADKVKDGEHDGGSLSTVDYENEGAEHEKKSGMDYTIAF